MSASNRRQSIMLMTILRIFPAEPWKARSPFVTLIHTILSQNTNDRNSSAAMAELRRHYTIAPETLSKARVEDLMQCIRSAGLYRSKAPRIKEVSRIMFEEYGGSLTSILRLPYIEAKEKLLSLPGVGPKTADILLSFVARHPVVPVDTHVARVTKRLGIAPSNAGYEKLRMNLEHLIPPSKRLSMHLSLIAFGRQICKARPRCSVCPVRKMCPSRVVEHQIN